MKLFNTDLYIVMTLMQTIMQVSIFIPMAVVWARRRHFSAPVRLLSWYVYLSLFCVLGMKLHPVYLANNYGFIIGFNCAKVALFAIIYNQVLTRPKVRKLMSCLTLAALTGTLVTSCYNLHLAIVVSRIAQCSMLAGLAILYFDQFANQRKRVAATEDPLWLLSLGQLLYSGLTVASFSFEYLSHTTSDLAITFFIVPIAGLIFNWFLTMAFLRARPDGADAEEVSTQPSQLAMGQ